jgi:hypothetical protein
MCTRRPWRHCGTIEVAKRGGGAAAADDDDDGDDGGGGEAAQSHPPSSGYPGVWGGTHAHGGAAAEAEGPASARRSGKRTEEQRILFGKTTAQPSKKSNTCQFRFARARAFPARGARRTPRAAAWH